MENHVHEEKLGGKDTEKIIGVISAVLEDIEQNKWNKVNGLLEDL